MHYVNKQTLMVEHRKQARRKATGMGHTVYGIKTGQVLGVLSDMDGVVLDTERLYARFWAEAANALR